MLFSRTKLINIVSNIPKGRKGPLKMSLEQSVHLELIIEKRGRAVLEVLQGQ